MYFVTICSYHKKCIFGSIGSGVMHLNTLREIVCQEWIKTAECRPNIDIDEFVVMPNHFHGIIVINDGVGTEHLAPTIEQFGKPTANSIPTIIRYFKAMVTKQIHLSESKNRKVWQRGYYEHIIRNEIALEYIREYIMTNPENWNSDSENPDQLGKDLFKTWLDQYNVPEPTNKQHYA